MKSLLVVGLDGATFDVLDRYVEHHPNGALARLRRHGTVRTLNSTLPYFTGPAWTTFMTGLRPDQHGVYHWRARYDQAIGERPLVSTRHLDEASYWWYLQQHGGRACISNFPMIYPAPPTEGVVICGTLALEDASQQTWPPHLASKIKDHIPGYRFEIEMGLSNVDEPDRLATHILQVGAGHLAAAVNFGQLDSADLAVHVVTITDRMQHFFWDADEPSPQILAAYCFADHALQTLMRARHWDNVVVVSDHGAGPSQQVFYTDQWLLDQGWARPGKAGSLDIPGSWAYAGEEPEVAVYVNRQDREGFGIPASDYLSFLDLIRHRLLAVRVPGTMIPAFTRVIFARDLPDGPMRDLGPDVILLPHNGIHPRPGLPGAIFGEPGGLVSGHRIQGIFLATGCDFPISADLETHEPLEMVNIFPILCAAQGIPVPHGIPHEHALAHLAMSHTVDTRWNWPRQVTERPHTQQQPADMTARLRELGYL